MEIAEAKVEGGGDDGAETKMGLEREKEEAVYLVWEKLTVLLVSNFKNVWGRKKRLLDEVTGFAEPGQIMAVMGPSGSGKSTFLDSLTGRLAGNAAMTGNILLNGKKRRLDYGVVAYVSQEDVLLGTLSVRETINFSARLRLSSNLTNEERNSVVEATITDLGLQDCADRLIGNWHLRGISGGEKKRLSIALEILTRPRLLFLDEPTSGLDSASAFFVIQTLRNISRDGRIVIASVHQPSSEVFALFDRLLLLSGGKTVYFGEAIGAVEFFAETGFPCPRQRNPSDHFLRCINSDFDAVAATLMGSRRKQLKIPNLYEEIPNSTSPLSHLSTEEIKAKLIDRYGSSKYAKSTRIRIQQLSTMEGLVGEIKCGSQAKWWKQLTALTRRSFVNMSRDVGYYWMRMVIYIILSISVGTIFFNVGTTYSSILARASCAAFVSGFMTFMSIGGFPSFIEEMKVFQKERKNGHYGVGVYTLSNFLSSFPFLAVMSITTATILFYMVKFRQEFSHYVYICLDFTSSIAVVESTMMIIASLVPNFLLGVIIGAGYIGIMMMTAGYFRSIPDLPKLFWRYPMSYLNYGAWALQGAFKNDMIGLEFDSFAAGGPKVKGEDILKSILGQQLHHSKWWDLAAVVSILITFRVLFFAILKLKERALPIFRTLVAESFLAPPRTLARVNQKMQSFPSKRHQPLQSLSSQEGLNSPHCTRSYNTLTMI